MKFNIKKLKTSEFASEYQSWRSMKKRCLNQSRSDYKYYGGKGIKVCKRWLCPKSGFLNFLSDLGRKPSEQHTLDRINSNKNYTKLNCRWATRKQQALNRRSTIYKFFNNTMSATDVSLKLGGYKQLVHTRLRAGWPFKLATTIPYTWYESLDKVLKTLQDIKK
jgi:hypothetical protein